MIDDRPWMVRLRRSYKYVLFLTFLILYTCVTTIVATVSQKHVKSPQTIVLSFCLLVFLLGDLTLRYKTQKAFFVEFSNNLDVVLFVALFSLLVGALAAQDAKIEGMQACYIMALCLLVTRCSTRLIALGFSLKKGGSSRNSNAMSVLDMVENRVHQQTVMASILRPLARNNQGQIQETKVQGSLDQERNKREQPVYQGHHRFVDEEI